MQLLPSSRTLIAALLGSSLLFTAAVGYAHGGGGHGGGHASHGTSNCGKSKAHGAGHFGSNTFDHFSPTPNAFEHADRAPGATDDAAAHAQESAGNAEAQQRYDQRSGDGD